MYEWPEETQCMHTYIHTMHTQSCTHKFTHTHLFNIALHIYTTLRVQPSFLSEIISCWMKPLDAMTLGSPFQCHRFQCLLPLLQWCRRQNQRRNESYAFQCSNLSVLPSMHLRSIRPTPVLPPSSTLVQPLAHTPSYCTIRLPSCPFEPVVSTLRRRVEANRRQPATRVRSSRISVCCETLSWDVAWPETCRKNWGPLSEMTLLGIPGCVKFRQVASLKRRHLLLRCPSRWQHQVTGRLGKRRKEGHWTIRSRLQSKS